jgi:hypothetical protein
MRERVCPLQLLQTLASAVFSILHVSILHIQLSRVRFLVDTNYLQFYVFTHNGSYLLYNLGTDHTENTVNKSSSIVSASVTAVTRCNVTFTGPFSSSRRLYWPHKSGFQQTCHNILISRFFDRKVYRVFHRLCRNFGRLLLRPFLVEKNVMSTQVRFSVVAELCAGKVTMF